MPRYLTNTRLGNKARCLEAARISGFDVRFEDEPMPNDTWNSRYNRECLIGTYGCMVSYDTRMDHSPFWRAWESLEHLAVGV